MIVQDLSSTLAESGDAMDEVPLSADLSDSAVHHQTHMRYVGRILATLLSYAARSPLGLLFANRNFALLWLGQIISQFGNSVHYIGMLWLVQELTGSRALMGTLAMVSGATVVMGFVGGALVDRWDRRRMMLVSDVARCVLVGMIPLLWVSGLLAVWHLFVVALALGVFSQLFEPAKQAIIPQLVSRQALTEANAISQGSMQIVVALGYALSGVLIGWMGTTALFTINAATFLLSAVSIWAICVPAWAREPQDANASSEAAAGETRTSLWADIGVGLRFIADHPLLSAGISVSLSLNFIFQPFAVLLAAWAKDVLQGGATAYGWLEASLVIGLLVGAVLSQPLAWYFPRGWLMTSLLIIHGLLVAVFTLFPILWLNMVIFVLMGSCVGVANVVFTSIAQEATPDEMMGRVFGSMGALSMLATPLGAFLSGVAGEYVSLQVIFATCGILSALASLLLVRSPAMRALPAARASKASSD